MIDSLHLTNFQVHKSSHLKFDKGINVIAGSSDAGKSSIIRGLLWLLTNKPSGESFRTWGSTGNIIVSASIDGKSVSKTRRSGKNTYSIGGTKYEATGTELFPELLEATRINEYNYQTQHQQYFLLQDSPGKVAEKINQVVGLDIIHRVASFLKSRLSEKKKLSVSISADIESKNKELIDYDNLEEIENLIQEIEDYETTISAVEAEKNTIGLILHRINLNQEKMDELPDYTGIEKTIREIRINIEKYDKIADQMREIKAMVGSIRVKNRKLDTIPDYTGIEDTLKAIRDNISKEEKTIAQKNTLARQVASLGTLYGREADAEKKLKEATTKHNELIKKLGVCPLCGAKMDAKKMLEKI